MDAPNMVSKSSGDEIAQTVSAHGFRIAQNEGIFEPMSGPPNTSILEGTTT
jgi:hypothetical protein